MKKAIEWVDTLVTPSGVDTRPSALLALVQEVRREALEAVELYARRQEVKSGSDAEFVRAELLRLLGLWKRENP